MTSLLRTIDDELKCVNDELKRAGTEKMDLSTRLRHSNVRMENLNCLLLFCTCPFAVLLRESCRLSLYGLQERVCKLENEISETARANQDKLVIYICMGNERTCDDWLMQNAVRDIR